MNIAHINTKDDSGGAAVAMRRLARALDASGHRTTILPGFKVTDGRLEEYLEGRIRGSKTVLSGTLYRIRKTIERRLGLPDWWRRSTYGLTALPEVSGADVVNLHNIHSGYFNVRALPHIAAQKPVVWTLHDMWALAGGCAFSYECDRWENGCYACPLMKPGQTMKFELELPERDQCRYIWLKKRSLYERSEFSLVVPSRWLEKCVQRSMLGDKPVWYCPNGIDPNTFRPRDRASSRKKLGLKEDIPYVLCSAAFFNYRKGYDILRSVLPKLARQIRYGLVVVGHGSLPGELETLPELVKLGYIDDDDSLAEAMASADVYVFPSRADNNPLVVMEAMACGIPVVAFDVGGVGELVVRDETGHLAAADDSDDFADGLATLLSREELRLKLGRNARVLIQKKYSINRQVENYLTVYETALRNHRKKRKSRWP